jgi:hypothetical protein
MRWWYGIYREVRGLAGFVDDLIVVRLRCGGRREECGYAG